MSKKHKNKAQKIPPIEPIVPAKAEKGNWDHFGDFVNVLSFGQLVITGMLSFYLWVKNIPLPAALAFVAISMFLSVGISVAKNQWPKGRAKSVGMGVTLVFVSILLSMGVIRHFKIPMKTEGFKPTDFEFFINKVPSEGSEPALMRDGEQFSIALRNKSEKTISSYSVMFSIKGCILKSDNPMWMHAPPLEFNGDTVSIKVSRGLADINPGGTQYLPNLTYQCPAGQKKREMMINLSLPDTPQFYYPLSSRD